MTALVELRGLTVDREGRRILDSISLHLGPGERAVLTGRNGAGKTTLLRAIVGLQARTSGSVTLAGIACATERDFRRARLRTGFLFQDPDDQLFCPTVIEDVAFGPVNQGHAPAAAIALAAAALADLGLGHLAERSVHRLSGGEKRLVCLAGLLVMRPDILLLDEPVNALDAAAGAALLDRLAGFGGAMIVASHDPALAGLLGARRCHLEGGHLSCDVIRG